MSRSASTAPPLPSTMREARALVSRAAATRHEARHVYRAEAHEPGPWHACGSRPCEAAQGYTWGGLDQRYVVPSLCSDHPDLDHDEDLAAHVPDSPCREAELTAGRCLCAECMPWHVERGVRLAALLLEPPAEPVPESEPDAPAD